MSKTPQGPRRIGILGGTFDPPQLGHITAATEVARQCDLDQVYFVPAGDPWQKNTQTSASDRYRMVALAIKDNPLFEISSVDIDREGPTYTVDTLRQFHQIFPQDLLFFLLGDEAFENITTWKSWEELGILATLVVMTRTGERPEVPEILIPSVNLCNVSALPISSTQCRERVQQGLNLDGFVPDAVAEYISQNQLYRRTR